MKLALTSDASSTDLVVVPTVVIRAPKIVILVGHPMPFLGGVECKEPPRVSTEPFLFGISILVPQQVPPTDLS